MKVNIGCGTKKIYGFTNVDIDPDVNPDLVDDIYLSTLSENSLELIYACHILEHIPRNECKRVLERWYSLLAKEGRLFIAIPDLELVFSHYILYKDLELLKGFIYGGQKTDFDFHCNGFDFKTITTLLKESGFKNISKFDCHKTDWSYIDDYSQAYLPHLDKTKGVLMSLNIKAEK